MRKLSAVIITLNEEHNISRCLQSLYDVADEIVVVDSYSNDNTVEIAKKFNARIIQQSFLGYTDQKKFADSHASYDWILSIDADEELSAELQQNIIHTKNVPEYDAYYLMRLNNYCGKWIRYSGWYPDKKIRLYDRTKGTWHGVQIHEYWDFDDAGKKTGQLSGDLLHYTYNTISDHIRQIEKFTEISARVAVSKGKKVSLFKIWFVPKWKFFVTYIIQLGFMDGYYGYLVCKYNSYFSSIKYMKIYQYNKLKKQGISF